MKPDPIAMCQAFRDYLHNVGISPIAAAEALMTVGIVAQMRAREPDGRKRRIIDRDEAALLEVTAASISAKSILRTELN
jgi:hypothetical protein